MTWIVHIMKLHIDISPKVQAENYSVFGGLLIRHNFSSAKGEASILFSFLFFSLSFCDLVSSSR
jgi:hypothetical protein